jgi:hypothetical protein
MMQKIKVLELPYLSSTIIRGPTLCTDADSLRLSMDYDDDGVRRSTTLRFLKDRAFRQRAEAYCTSWHFVDTFDTVCEVQQSDWVKELRHVAARVGQDRWIMRHFIIYVDDLGCLEVVAESAVLDDGARNSGGT